MFSFYDYDSSILVRRLNDLPKENRGVISTPEDVKNLLLSIKRLFLKNNYEFYYDPYILKKYPILKNSHFAGHKGDLKFILETYPMGLKIEFYQELNYENKSGGRYDFNKFSKMPYLIKKQFLLIKNKLIACFEKRKISNNLKKVPANAYEAIHLHRKELEDFQGNGFYSKPISFYNAKDADGNQLVEGEERYFYDYNGKLGRGKVYYNINNMWWVLCNNHCYKNVASFDLFQWKEGMPLKKKDKKKILESLLQKTIKEQNFEKSIILRDILKKETANAELCPN